MLGFALYFGIGFAWKKTQRQAEGWDAIPNIEFWQELPYLVKVGGNILCACIMILHCFNRMGFYLLLLNHSSILREE